VSSSRLILTVPGLGKIIKIHSYSTSFKPLDHEESVFFQS
jgi:hypothetical protein